MFASGSRFWQTQVAAGAAALLLALVFAGSAEAETFTLYCVGTINVEGLDPDGFEVGPLQRNISQADQRFWTPEYHEVGGEDVFITEAEWNNNNFGYTWWQAQVAQAQAKSKSKAGFDAAGVAVYDPRVQWINPDHVATGHTLACASSGGYIIIPDLGHQGGLGVQGGMLGVDGSQWMSVAQPTEKELPPLPIDTPFQFDVLVTSEVRCPENIARVTVEIFVDGEPLASGFAELSSGGVLYQSGLLEGVFLPPTYEPGSGELFGELQVELELPEGWRVVRQPAEGGLGDTGPATPTSVAPVVRWSESFDLYENGSGLHGQNGWQGWDNDTTFDAFVTDAQARSAPHSVDVAADSDLVHEFDAYTSGKWIFTAWQYIPADFTSDNGAPFPPGTYFLLLNKYNDGGPYNWSVQFVFDSNDGMLKVSYGDGHNTIDVPYVTDRWVKLQADIDLDSDLVAVSYDGEVVVEYSWTGGIYGDGGGALEIGAVDLFANGSSSAYYDDISLSPARGP